MFGSSNLLKQGDTDVVVDSHSPPKSKSPSTDGTAALEEVKSGAKRNNATSSPGAKSQDEDSPSGDKKRRSSSVSKASSLFASAKNSLHLHHGSNSATGGLSDPHAPQTPMQKLGKIDPALAVAQGPNNNSAGESLPGPRSTFKVGVTEDKNKKCRRTMEDTHSYLYNFLSTPAPIIGPGSSSLSKKSTSGSSTAASDNSTASSKADIIESDNGYFAIFDGHAGNFAAEWCGKKLHLILEDHIRKNPNTPIPELLDQTFTSVDQQLDKLPLKNSGCTAVTAVLRWEDRIPNPQSATGSTAIAPATAAAVKAVNEAHKAEDPSKNASDPSLTSTSSTSSQTKTEAAATAIAPPFQSTLSSAQVKLAESASRQRVLYTANVGDARIVLCRSGKALRLSYDHKGSDENEGRRVANAGGLILNNRVNGVLAVTRALGDAYMKDLVTGHPYTTETVIQPEIDEFLILACDGLWDVCSDQEAVDLIRNQPDPQIASKILVEHALARFSTDNLSCMVVRFDNKASTQHQQTDLIGVEGDPPTRQGGISEAEKIVLEATEKAVESGTVAIDRERIPEEQEPGPELDPKGIKELQKPK